ncbi:hypothetical protein OV203_25990 [Nannocystis sp. ILAH1]|uniref:hypothetical protein n=1 Tax=Nannocystis sp. ILAH1 TaxID=2996789 RepID=UPI0022701D44|nr:hypothetical protein [Nannocystis sp. ILAH1]MCY0990621.1 hypothetical protein [Nannocystis sp. ILAH1]
MAKRGLPVSIAGYSTTKHVEVAGGRLAKLSTLEAAAVAQDPLVVWGSRIVATAGLLGTSSFAVLNGSNPSSMTQIYPEEDHERILLQTRVRLTPGTRPAVVALALPSGPTQYEMDMGAWRQDSLTGSLIILCNWDDGTNNYNTVWESNSVPSSGELYGSEPQAFHPLGIRRIQANIPHPNDVEDAPSFSGEVTLTIEIRAKGSLRLIDCAVYEKPYEYWRDDTHREGPFHIATAKYPSEYAITGIDASGETDFRYGPRQFLKTLRDQRSYLGPTIFQWSAHDESTGSVTATEPTPATTGSTTLGNILHTNLTSWIATRPGWSISSGTGRPAEWNGLLELRERNGVLPVTCRVYCKVSSGTGTIRFQSENYSLTELTTTSTSYTWVEGLAWLRCGLHQNLFSVLSVLARVSTLGVTLSILYVSVDYGGHYKLEQ